MIDIEESCQREEMNEEGVPAQSTSKNNFNHLLVLLHSSPLFDNFPQYQSCSEFLIKICICYLGSVKIINCQDNKCIFLLKIHCMIDIEESCQREEMNEEGVPAQSTSKNNFNHLLHPLPH